MYLQAQNLHDLESALSANNDRLFTYLMKWKKFIKKFILGHYM